MNIGNVDNFFVEGCLGLEFHKYVELDFAATQVLFLLNGTSMGILVWVSKLSSLYNPPCKLSVATILLFTNNENGRKQQKNLWT